MGFLKSLVLLALVGVLGSGCSTFGYHSLDEEIGGELAITPSQEQKQAQLKLLHEEAEGFYTRGELVSARQRFEAILQQSDNDESALYRLGTIAFKEGRFKDSTEFFEKVIGVNPRNQKAQYNLASLRLMQAENHFKYYAALAGRGTNLDRITKLLGDIDQFTNQNPSKPSDSLEEIAGALKK